MVKFFRLQIVGGMFLVMVLFDSQIPVTEFSVQLISGQSQGDDVVFQELRDGGFPSSCLRLRRMDSSSAFGIWEFTWMGMEIRRRTKIVTRSTENRKGNLGILGILVSYFD